MPLPTKKGNQTYIDAFFEAFEANSKGNVKLASPDIFANRTLQGEGGIDFQMTDDQAKKIIRKKVDESVDSAFGVLRERIDKFGVTQPNIQKLGETGRILVELPGAKMWTGLRDCCKVRLNWSFGKHTKSKRLEIS